MSNLVSAVWPYTVDELSYHHGGPFSHRNVKVLRICEEGVGEPGLDFAEHRMDQVIHDTHAKGQCCVELVVVTRSWKTVSNTHIRVAHYDISQEDLTSILEHQGLGCFYRQTRAYVAGVYTLSLSSDRSKERPKGDYLALVYDANLGFWARYDNELKQWQGLCMLPETSLNIQSIAEELRSLASSKTFMYLLAAKFTVNLLNIKSGELPGQVAKIERHSGHHFSILSPVPATYAKLEKISADATATANLVSYYKIVISRLAEDILDCCKGTTCDQDEKTSTEVEQQIASLTQGLKALSIYMMYLERRAERQVTATLHLVNQANACTNLAMAHNTQAIARASKHDSSSMKMLAAVTTTFLPGAFVAAFFSMNMFNWFASRDEPVISGRFWFYWCITIPLTFLTVGFWRLWEYRLVSKGGYEPL
jgi:hypothetical protein